MSRNIPRIFIEYSKNIYRIFQKNLGIAILSVCILSCPLLCCVQIDKSTEMFANISMNMLSIEIFSEYS